MAVNTGERGERVWRGGEKEIGERGEISAGRRDERRCVGRQVRDRGDIVGRPRRQPDTLAMIVLAGVLQG